jgi:hypothetical protein
MGNQRVIRESASEATSPVRISVKTKGRLEQLKVHPRETYDQVIRRIIAERGSQ